MSQILEYLRDDLRKGDGVMYDAGGNNWDWGTIISIVGEGKAQSFLVEFYRQGGRYTKLCEREHTYPDDYAFDDHIWEASTAKSEATTPDDNLVFVYGTLKKKGRLNSVLKGSEFLGEALTDTKKYALISIGDAYPAVVDGMVAIKGEVYRVCDATLSHLDYIEGVPHLYRREMVKIKGFERMANMYVASFSLKSAYKGQFGSKILFDEDADAHVWEN